MGDPGVDLEDLVLETPLRLRMNSNSKLLILLTPVYGKVQNRDPIRYLENVSLRPICVVVLRVRVSIVNGNEKVLSLSCLQSVLFG